MLVELFLSNPDGLGEVVIRQFRIDDLLAMPGQERRFDAARNRMPAVEEEDFHGGIVLPGRSAGGKVGQAFCKMKID